MKLNRWYCVSVWEVSSVMSDFLWPFGLCAPVSSVHVILQARIVECVAMPSSGDLPDPGDLPNPGAKPTSLRSPVLAGGVFFVFFFTTSATQFGSVVQSCPTLCDPTNHSTPGLPVHHQLLEFTQTHVHRVGDAIQPSHPLSSPSPPAPNPSQHQSLFSEPKYVVQ